MFTGQYSPNTGYIIQLYRASIDKRYLAVGVVPILCRMGRSGQTPAFVHGMGNSSNNRVKIWYTNRPPTSLYSGRFYFLIERKLSIRRDFQLFVKCLRLFKSPQFCSDNAGIFCINTLYNKDGSN